MNIVILIGYLGSDAERRSQPYRWPRSAPGRTAKLANFNHRKPGTPSSLFGIEPVFESVFLFETSSPDS